MKRTLFSLLTVLFLSLALSAGGDDAKADKKMAKKCSADTQTCLNHMAQTFASSAWDGIWVEGIGSDKVAVIKVDEDSAGAKAEVKVGDVLVAMNDTKLAGLDIEQFNKVMASAKIGDVVTYKIRRGDEWLVSKVTMTAMPKEQSAKMVGAHLLAAHAQKNETVASY